MFGLSYCYRDVDLNASRIDVWEKKSCKDVECLFLSYFFFFFVQSEVPCGGENHKRENITYCTLKSIV